MSSSAAYTRYSVSLITVSQNGLRSCPPAISNFVSKQTSKLIVNREKYVSSMELFHSKFLHFTKIRLLCFSFFFPIFFQVIFKSCHNRGTFCRGNIWQKKLGDLAYQQQCCFLFLSKFLKNTQKRQTRSRKKEREKKKPKRGKKLKQ